MQRKAGLIRRIGFLLWMAIVLAASFVAGGMAHLARQIMAGKRARDPETAQAGARFEELAEAMAEGDEKRLMAMTGNLPGFPDAIEPHSGEPLLVLAAELGATRAVAWLLDSGARPDLCGRTGHSPLAAVLELEDETAIAIIDLLAGHGAEVSCRGPDGKTPLHLMAAHGSAALVRRLLELGADPTARDGNGKTPAELAMASGREEVAQLITEWGGPAG